MIIIKINTIQQIKRTHRFPFRFIDFLNGLFLILPTILILLSIIMIRSYKMNNMTEINGLLITATLIGLIGLTLFPFIVIRLIQNIRFRVIETELNLNKNIKIVEKAFSNLYDKQSIDKQSIDLGLIISNSCLSGLSWGEINTIICMEKVILINSRPKWQPITIFENRLNLKRIIRAIQNEIKPSPQQKI